MVLVFCCPSCGHNIRIHPPQKPASLHCPACSEVIRVPKHIHPAEVLPDSTAFRAHEAYTATFGIDQLFFSLILFIAATSLMFLGVVFRLALVGQPWQQVPIWIPTLMTAMTTLALLAYLLGCGLRWRGYRACARASSRLNVDGWTKAATLGAILTAIGIGAMSPRMLGPAVPMTYAPIVIIGLIAGLIGVILEFSILTPLHRFLSETQGYIAASRTSDYMLTVVFVAVASMVVLVAGSTIAFINLGGRAVLPLRFFIPPPELRVITLATLGTLGALLSLVCLKYGRLLRLTRRGLQMPKQPHQDMVRK